MSNASLLPKLGFCFLICALFTTSAYAQFSVMYTYGSHANDPVDPQSSTRIAQGRDGNLYSTAFQGAANNAGAAFVITPGGALTVLYSFCSQSACADGAHPEGGLTLGTDGDFYGTTSGGGNTNNAYGDGVVFKMTSAGVPTVLHVFTAATDGNFPYAAPVEGLDGNFYGTTSAGGSGGCGTIYKVTPGGAFNILHTFANSSTDGCSPHASLVLGTDGNFYGTASSGAYSTFKITPAGKYTHLTSGGVLPGGYAPLIQAPNGTFYGSNGGQIFKMTTSGAISILHPSTGVTDPNGYGYNSGLVWGSDGNIYGDTQTGGTTANCSSNLGYCGVIFKMTAAGGYTNLHDFENPDGFEGTPVIQNTNGIMYGQANFGGVINGNLVNAGTFWSWAAPALKPFVSFMPFTGHVGDQIQIFGQGFTNSSVVKFNGVVASHALTGTTFITATVPPGTLDGYVTVTTGGTTLKSLYKFLVHDSWGNGAAIPTPVAFATASALGGKIYVVGGYTTTTYTGATGANQIYNPVTNSWTSGAALATGTAQAASATVNNILYVFGGTDGSTDFNAVWAYNPKTNSWSSKTAMPTARRSASATVYKSIIYVIGGFNPGGGRLNTVEAYDPATDSWSEKAPLLDGKSEPAVGVVGSSILASDGYTQSSADNGDNEKYNTATNTWTSLKVDPTPRNGDCYGVVGTLMYVAGGGNSPGPAITTLESYALSGNAWTTLTPMPIGMAVPASAVNAGMLYCIGGWATSPNGTLLNNVQIYQP